MKTNSKMFPTSIHWGNYWFEKSGEGIVAVRPDSRDVDPSPIGQPFEILEMPTYGLHGRKFAKGICEMV